MKTIEEKNYIDFISSDENGKFTFRILKNRPVQISLFNKDNNTYVEVSIGELKEIRNCIDKVINLHP